MFECYDDVQNPVVVGRSTLKRRIALRLTTWLSANGGLCLLRLPGSAGHATDPNNYVPDPDTPIVDLAWMSEWQQAAMAPGAVTNCSYLPRCRSGEHRVDCELGLKQVQDSVALAVEGPRSLQYDSTTTGQNDLTPNPFTITAYVYNLATDTGPYNLSDVNAFAVSAGWFGTDAGSNRAADRR